MATATVNNVSKIFWVKSAQKFGFVRTATVAAHTRSGKISAPEGAELYGYEQLPEDATRGSNGKFNRTVYFRYEDDQTLMEAPAASATVASLQGKGRKTPAAKKPEKDWAKKQ